MFDALRDQAVEVTDMEKSDASGLARTTDVRRSNQPVLGKAEQLGKAEFRPECFRSSPFILLMFFMVHDGDQDVEIWNSVVGSKFFFRPTQCDPSMHPP